MGNVIRSLNNTVNNIKAVDKAKRLGWVHRSKYNFRSIREINAHADKLQTYSFGPFADNKLVP